MKRALLVLALLVAPLYAGAAQLESGQIRDGAVTSQKLSAGAAAQNGAVPHVASVTALRSYDHTLSPVVIRDGFAAAGDAPPLTEVWFDSCPGTADNLALYTAPISGSGCWSAKRDPNLSNFRAWGAVYTGNSVNNCAVNDASAFQAAINAMGAGTRFRVDGWACLSSVVTIAKSGIGIDCDGADDGMGHDVGSVDFDAPAGIVAGTFGQTLIKFKSDAITAISGNRVVCTLSGNHQTGVNFGLANIGVDAFSVRKGYFRLSGGHFQTSILQADIDTSITEAAGFTLNDIAIHGMQSLQFDGSHFVCNGTLNWDCSGNNYQMISGITSGAFPAISFNGSDSESIFNVSLYDNRVGGLTCTVYLPASNNSLTSARNIMFHYVNATNSPCPVYAEGTENGKSVPALQNHITNLDTPNNSTLPTIGVGAVLDYGTTNTPQGYRAFARTTNSYNKVTADGGRQMAGVAVIATNSNQVITLPNAFGTACIRVTAVPSAGVPIHAACTTTTITLWNDGSSSSTGIYWSVDGY